MPDDSTKPKVIYLPNGLVHGGGYTRMVNTIGIEQLLKDEFPELHDKVLAHEMGHARYGYNPWKHFVWDCFDSLPIITSPEWYAYDKRRGELVGEGEQLKEDVCAVGYYALHVTVGLLTTWPYRLGSWIAYNWVVPMLTPLARRYKGWRRKSTTLSRV